MRDGSGSESGLLKKNICRFVQKWLNRSFKFGLGCTMNARAKSDELVRPKLLEYWKQILNLEMSLTDPESSKI